MAEPSVLLERRGPVATLTMRHGKANALDVELFQALLATLDQVERERADALVITGTGSIFSAGVNLRRVVDGGPDYVRRLLPLLRTFYERLAFFERPVVAAVNGHAIAGGFVTAVAADQVLMTSGRGTIGVTELKVGVSFPAIALELVRLRVGSREAAHLISRALTIDPAEALARHVVDELVEPERLLDRAHELAAELAAAGTAFTLTKELLRRPLRELVAMAGDGYERRVEEAWQSDTTLATMRRYAEAVLSRPRE
jgi:enoyl-CoA hydratase/carnithine racemase